MNSQEPRQAIVYNPYFANPIIEILLGNYVAV